MKINIIDSIILSSSEVLQKIWNVLSGKTAIIIYIFIVLLLMILLASFVIAAEHRKPEYNKPIYLGDASERSVSSPKYENKIIEKYTDEFNVDKETKNKSDMSLNALDDDTPKIKENIEEEKIVEEEAPIQKDIDLNTNGPIEIKLVEDEEEEILGEAVSRFYMLTQIDENMKTYEEPEIFKQETCLKSL